jgi:hypothetical protein
MREHTKDEGHDDGDACEQDDDCACYVGEGEDPMVRISMFENNGFSRFECEIMYTKQNCTPS